MKLLALTLLASARGDDDDVTLLQLARGKVASKAGDLEDALKELGTIQDPTQAELLVEKLAEAATKDGVKIDDETKTVLEGMKRTFEDTSEVSIRAAHEEDRKLLGEHAEAVANCAVQYTADQAEDASLGGAVSNKKLAHSSCQAEVQKLDDERTTHCDNLDNFRMGLTPPSCAVPSSNDAMHGYLTAMKSFGSANLENWERLHKLCADATEEYEA